MTQEVPLSTLREDLALALRAASMHGLAEGVCNHFSVACGPNRFLLNPRGLHWSELQARDILLVDEAGKVLDGPHPVEPTALFIHAAVHRVTGHAVVMHTHMPHATAFTLTQAGAIDPLLSQNGLRYLDRIVVDREYNGLALDMAEGERIARAMGRKDIAFLGNHGVVVAGATIAHAYDDLYYLERAAQHEMLARASGLPLTPIRDLDLARRTARQIQGERMQSDLFFEALRRLLPPA
ncbi:aldolase [Ramlibacter albus]|uniref:Aldolase n=1 Tax=Ramlibacter albus TaxID=2079448 RepID=A0A923S2C0_9BURK|nr:aldolase [Ramlibacter albus]MBC5765215.1 aldolase [Ramlibacter albus]